MIQINCMFRTIQTLFLKNTHTELNLFTKSNSISTSLFYPTLNNQLTTGKLLCNKIQVSIRSSQIFSYAHTTLLMMKSVMNQRQKLSLSKDQRTRQFKADLSPNLEKIFESTQRSDLINSSNFYSMERQKQIQERYMRAMMVSIFASLIVVCTVRVFTSPITLNTLILTLTGKMILMG